MATKRIENLVKLVNDRLQPVLEFDRFYAALYSPIKSLVEFPWVTQDGQPVEWESRPYRPATWLLDSMIQAKKPRLAEQDTERELRDGGLEYWPPGNLPQSWLAVPMVVKGRAIGAIVVENRRKPRAFGENILRVLSSVAQQTAQAIENARLVERLNALYKMGPELNSRIRLGELAILQLIYEQASELMDTSNLYVALYEAEADSVRFPLMYVDGQPTQVEARSGGKGRTEWIIHNRKPIFIETRNESVKWYQDHEGTEYIGEPFASWVGVPMTAGDRVLGVIATYHKIQDYVYTKHDQEVLSLMGNQAAVAIENARLYSNLEEQTQNLQTLTMQLQTKNEELTGLTQQLQKRNEQLAALQNISTIITSQLKLEDVLSTIVEHTNDLFEADFSTLFPYYSERSEFGKGIRKGKVTLEPSIPSSTGYSGHLARGNDAVFVEDTENEPGVKPTFIENKKVKSFAGIPLLSKGKTVGVLYVNYLQHHKFSQEERAGIGLLANQAAVAIENARLYAEMEQRVQQRTQEWLRAQQKLIAAERQAAINSVAGELVHKMNNLAGTIPARVKLGKEKLDPEVPRDKRLIDILDGIQNDTLNLLEAAKYIRESTATETVVLLNANEIMQIAVTRTREAFPAEFERIRLIDTYLSSSVYVAAPRNALLRALEHLLHNAVEAMPNGGELHVTTREVTAQDRQLIEMLIVDSGVGIKPTDLPKVFDLYFTTKAQGLGFGLWDVKNIIKGIEGEIDVELRNPGTEFRLRIPKATWTDKDIRPEVQAVA
jgi:GAF domain-containing protein